MRGIGYAWAMGVLALVGMATPGRAGVSTTGDTSDNGLYFYVGYDFYKTGTLEIDSGSVLNRQRVYIGYSSASTGTGTIRGTGSKLISELYVGDWGSGTLQVEAGGQVSGSGGTLGSASGSTGTAVITGAGSKWSNSSPLYVGWGGSGTLRVEAGAQVNSDTGYMGYNSGSMGAVTITGTGSQWVNSSAFRVGNSGSGTLTVEAGGQVSCTAGFLGYNSGSTGAAILTGAGSKWTNSQGLYVGLSGSSTLRVEGGGQVSSYAGTLGYNSGSTGEAVVTGAASTWTNSDKLYVGYNGSGTLRVEAGAQVSNISGILAYNSGSTGSAIITGAGSKWTNSDTLTVGHSASSNGTLRVEAGGQVSDSWGYVGGFGSTGSAIVTGAGSKWTNTDLFVGQKGSGTLTVSDGGLVSAKALYASLSDLSGDGSITVQGGGVLDADLSFDATHGLTQTRGFGSGGTLQLTVDGTRELGVGYKHSGSLRIAEGRSVASTDGFLGYHSGSTGEALITGAGSTWNNSRGLYVGSDGSGMLRVEAGAQVSSTWGELGDSSAGSTGTAIITGDGSKWTNSGQLDIGRSGSGTLRVEAGGQLSSSLAYLGLIASTGTAVVTGSGSKWTNSNKLYVGSNGRGTLTVSDGGQVTAGSLSINDQSTVRLHVSGDRMLVLGDASTVGGMSNGGRLALLADAFLPAGTYRPIDEYGGRNMSWSGSGSTLAVGGIWDSDAKTFTVIEPVRVNSGTVAEVTGGMRVVIRDVGSGERAGVSFGSLSSGTTLTGMPLAESERAALALMLDSKEMILSGWEFDGQLAGGEALVSFDIGLGAEGVRVWRRSQGGWSEYTAEMMTYDAKGIVSFTVDPGSFSSGGYAVSGVVPEPGVVGVLAIAAGMMLKRRGRKDAARPEE